MVLDRETDPDLQDSAKASGKAPFRPGQTRDAFQKGAYLRQATLTECGWGQAGRFLETRREMLGVTEAGRKGHIDDAVPRFRQSPLGLIDPKRKHIVIRCRANALMKCAQEMPLAQPGDPRKFCETDRLGEVLAHILLKAPEASARQATAQFDGWLLTSFTDARNVSQRLNRPPLRHEVENVVGGGRFAAKFGEATRQSIVLKSNCRIRDRMLEAFVHERWIQKHDGVVEGWSYVPLTFDLDCSWKDREL
jgi:hypothetical protein